MARVIYFSLGIQARALQASCSPEGQQSIFVASALYVFIGGKTAAWGNAFKFKKKFLSVLYLIGPLPHSVFPFFPQTTRDKKEDDCSNEYLDKTDLRFDFPCGTNDVIGLQVVWKASKKRFLVTIS